MAAMHAVLTEVMTDQAYAHMESLAEQLANGLSAVIEHYRAPWHVVRVGARIEFVCAPGPLRNGSEALAAHEPELEQAIHLGLVNRGCLIAPFHNMMLTCPTTTRSQVEALITAFRDVTDQLMA
jgi:glutamate-1-semialdehyde 2,1-aminomutase